MTAHAVRTIPVTTRPGPGTVTPRDLVELADRRLPRLLRPSGLFCFEVDQRDPSPGEVLAGPALHGESVRYSIMVVIGALRQRAATGTTSLDVEGHLAAVQRYRPALGFGDLGLLLWAESRFGHPDVTATISALERRTDEELRGLVGMEVAWIAIGAISAFSAGHPTWQLADRAMGVVVDRIRPGGRLVMHRSTGRTAARTLRSRFPNFATEIYSLLALVESARYGVVDGALDRARRLADLLIDRQGADGGWPWLFDARSERLVEPFEIYSVHQDAMAPMAFLPLADLTGDDRYRRAAYDGLAWLTGRNPLGRPLVDLERSVVHRSIRRRPASARLHLAVNTVASSVGVRARLDGRELEIDRTCRPYHLGWILEAWSPTVGRSSDADHLARGVES